MRPEGADPPERLTRRGPIAETPATAALGSTGGAAPTAMDSICGVDDGASTCMPGTVTTVVADDETTGAGTLAAGSETDGT
jgi:hypothetical protein